MTNENKTHKKILKDVKEKAPNQRQNILNALRVAGDEGILNTELVKICIRFTGRLAELYKMGYEVKTDYVDKSLVKYTLVKEPIVEKTTHKTALELVFEEINKTYSNSISKEELSELLKSKNFNIVRKYGSNKVS